MIIMGVIILSFLLIVVIHNVVVYLTFLYPPI